MGAVETFDVGSVERSRPWLYGFESRSDLIEEAFFKYTGFNGGLVHVVRKYVPPSEDKVIQPCKRHELLDGRHPVFRSFAEPNSPHLSKRADRFGNTLPYRFDSGDECGADGAHPGQNDAQLSICRSDIDSIGAHNSIPQLG